MSSYAGEEYFFKLLRENKVAFGVGIMIVVKNAGSTDGAYLFQQIRPILQGEGIQYIIFRYDDKVILLASSDDKRDFMLAVSNGIDYLKRRLQCTRKIHILVSVGTPFYDFAGAHRSLRYALEGLDRASGLQDVFWANEIQTRLDDWKNKLSEIVSNDNLKLARNCMQRELEQVYDSLLQYNSLQRRLRSILEGLLKHVDEKKRGLDVLSVENLFEQINDKEQFLSAADAWICSVFQYKNSFGSMRVEAVMQNVKTYIDENYQSDIYLQLLAEEAQYSNVYFGKMFKKYFKQTFIEYLTNVRVEKAKQYLHDPIYKIKDISEKVGFHDSNYFAYVFQKSTGYTPSKYRENVLSHRSGES